MVISVIALSVSVCSFVIVLLAYRRDRTNVHAWSTISWWADRSDTGMPIMYVRIVNVGRRPVSMLNLVKVSPDATWSRSLWRAESGGKPKVVDVETAVDYMQRRSVAHSAAITLGEGAVYELMFRPDDVDEFIDDHEYEVRVAISLLIEDVTGKRYPVKNSVKNLQQLLDWSPRERQSREPVGVS